MSVRTWWVGAVGAVLLSVNALAAAPRLSVAVDSNLTIQLSRDYEIVALAQPHKGDAWSRLSLRLTGDAAAWKKIAELNSMGDNLMTDRAVRLPLSMLRPELQRKALARLFASDRQSEAGWEHRVTAGGAAEGEPLWKIAEWFTGDGANYTALRKANGGLTLSTRKGDTVLVPRELLLESLREPRTKPARAETTVKSAPVTASPAEEKKVSETKSVERKSRPTPEVESSPVVLAKSTAADSRKPSSEPAVAVASLPPVTQAPIALEYVTVGGEDFGVYRLQRGEALYSSVVVRFTGRVYAKDVNEAVERIILVNEIADVSRIAVDTPIRIPLDLLTPEHLPSSNARRVEWETAQRESGRVARRVAAKDLKGVYVILDAGHGGRDVGTSHDDTWESVYVYDVVMRLKRQLEKKSGAKVFVTTRSKASGYEVAKSDVLPPRTDHVVLTNPEYALEDATVGVNLRWYLANSIFNRAVEKSIDPHRVVFISVHADSLHPSLRGAMAYIPGARYVQGSFTKKGKVYLARAEVRENPSVTQTADDALAAEGLSRGLADSIINAISAAELPVHPYLPVRDNVVRGGKEWVPAVIRYNKVPTRLLLEICNLGNVEDREQVQTRKYRQKLADAIYDGLVGFFDAAPGGGVQPPSVRAAAR
jgi:N-acetylmuramoyl-L-alanine amidase